MTTKKNLVRPKRTGWYAPDVPPVNGDGPYEAVIQGRDGQRNHVFYDVVRKYWYVKDTYLELVPTRVPVTVVKWRGLTKC